MGLPKKLTEMQIKFAQLLVTNEGRKTPTECAIEAGYNKDRATITASELQSPRTYPSTTHLIPTPDCEYAKRYNAIGASPGPCILVSLCDAVLQAEK